MSSAKNLGSEDKCTYILITGANQGLGFATCKRLIDDFLFQKPKDCTIHLIITTRSAAKSASTVKALRARLERSPQTKALDSPRVSISSHEVDLCSLRQIRAAAAEIAEAYPRIDVLICNAGIAGWSGLNWPRCLWKVFTDPLEALSFPDYYIGIVGMTTDPQLPEGKDGKKPKEPPLGAVFCANLFGHYFLMHHIAPLLLAPPNSSRSPSRIIFVSSSSSLSKFFSLGDFQALAEDNAYGSSKRLTDILALTATLPPSAPHVASFLTASPTSAPPPPSSWPRFYLSHPGVVGTEILPLHWTLRAAKMVAFVIVRLAGSPWHTMTGHKAAVSAAWLALAPRAAIEGAEAEGGASKWGSATDRWGTELVKRTEVEGWGWCGRVGEEKRWGSKGRKRGAVDLTEEARAQFEVDGGKAWAKMEELRMEWEARLDAV